MTHSSRSSDFTEEDELAKEYTKLSVFRESKLSKKFSELSTQRVVILVLVVTMGIPLFTFDTYFSEKTSMEYSV
jgi:hypothetical protein